MCNNIRPCVLDLLKSLQSDESDCNGTKNDHVRKRRRTNSQGSKEKENESKEKENEEDKPKNYTDDQVKDVLRCKCIFLSLESFVIYQLVGQKLNEVTAGRFLDLRWKRPTVFAR